MTRRAEWRHRAEGQGEAIEATLFRSLLESGLIGIVESDLTGAIKSANDYFLNLVGYSREDLRAGRINWRTLTAPEFALAQAQAIRELKERRVHTPYEKEYIRKDGSRVNGLVGSTQIEPAKPDLISFVLDISARKNAEKALKESELRFRTILDSAAIGMLLLDTTGKIVEVNAGFCEMLGYSAEEIKKRGIRGISHPDDYVSSGVATLQLLQGKIDKFTLENRYIHRNGKPVWVKLAVSLARDANENPAFCIGIALDISDDKKIEDSLRSSEERFRAVFESGAVGMALGDTTGNYVACNPAFCQMVGYSLEELKELGVKKVTHPDDIGKEVVLISRFAAGEIDGFEMEKRYLRKDGSILWGHLIVNRAKGFGEISTYAVLMLFDVTEQKRTEEERDRLLALERSARSEAEKAVRIRDDFIAIASHELKTPITPLKMQLQIIRKFLDTGEFDHLPRAEELRRLTSVSEQQLDRLTHLVNDMLNSTRISAGRLSLNREDIDLSELVQEVVIRFGEEILRRGYAVNLELQPGVVGHLDRIRIEEVVVNLLSNAMKYGAGKPITFSVSASGSVATLSVRDQGIGIKQEDQARIFKQFERLAPIQTAGGFGLGLYITHQIVTAHGGKISVKSEPGNGSTFAVELPLKRPL